MNLPANRIRQVGLYLFGLATGIVLALICSAIHAVLSMLPKPVSFTAENYDTYRQYVWTMELSQRSFPWIELPSSATDIMFTDVSGLDKNVFISFRASPDDINAYINEATKDSRLERRAKGQYPDKESVPNDIPDKYINTLKQYWLSYAETDYYYVRHGLYIGVDDKSHRVFINMWTQ